MKDFLKKIDKHGTKKRVIENLENLKHVVGSTSYISYQNLSEDIELLSIINSDRFIDAICNAKLDRKTLLDYLPSYTRRIIGMPNTSLPKNAQDLKMLTAMEEKDCADRIDAMKELNIRWLLDGITKLEDKEKCIIIDKYLFKLSDHIIMTRNDIADRTYSRMMQQAYMNLAIIWNVKVFSKR